MNLCVLSLFLGFLIAYHIHTCHSSPSVPFVPSSSCATSAGLLVCHRILAYQLVCFPDGLYVRCDSMITTFHSIDKGLCFVEIAL